MDYDGMRSDIVQVFDEAQARAARWSYDAAPWVRICHYCPRCGSDRHDLSECPRVTEKRRAFERSPKRKAYKTAKGREYRLAKAVRMLQSGHRPAKWGRVWRAAALLIDPRAQLVVDLRRR